MLQINRLTALEVLNSFYHDEGLGCYISSKLSLSIPEDFGREKTFHRGNRVRFTQSNGVLCMIIGHEVISAKVLYHLIAGELPKELNDVEFGLLECLPYYTNQKEYVPEQYYLRHQFVDVYDSNTGKSIYAINKGQAMELLDCRRSMIYDLVSPEYSGRIGYKGYFLRPHQEEPFGEEDVHLDNEYYADEHGIFLMVNMKDTDKVVVTGNMYGIVDTIAQTQDKATIPTIQEVQEYFKVNDLESGFYGWKIRRIDDIHGINVRFTELTDAQGLTL